VSSSPPARSEDQLTPEERQRLEDAHRRLQKAVEAYQPFTGRELKRGEPVHVHNLKDMATAQAAVEAAEQELWRLREELLGWARPSWAPNAGLVADWFSDDDAAYDDIKTGSDK
jgi:inorganic triphosphatase YgiF